jgi:8-oxo-dGTP pyrophosphatase MutT (NUDIX family)
MNIVTQSDAVRHTANQWDSATALLTTNPVPAGREAVWAQALKYLDVGQRDGAHLVASVLVIDDGGLVLLARHHRYRKWGPLGGHLDPGDSSLSAAAARELLEETALAAHVHPAPINALLASYRCRTVVEPVLHLDVCFAAFIAAPAPALIANNELTGLEWFDPRSLPARLTPPTAELVGLATAAAALRR